MPERERARSSKRNKGLGFARAVIQRVEGLEVGAHIGTQRGAPGSYLGDGRSYRLRHRLYFQLWPHGRWVKLHRPGIAKSDGSVGPRRIGPRRRLDCLRWADQSRHQHEAETDNNSEGYDRYFHSCNTLPSKTSPGGRANCASLTAPARRRQARVAGTEEWLRRSRTKEWS